VVYVHADTVSSGGFWVPRGGVAGNLRRLSVDELVCELCDMAIESYREWPVQA